MAVLKKSSSGFAFLCSPESWDEDQLKRFNVVELTEAFHESVPSLKFLEWKITEVSRGRAETVLPLNVTSTNQYVTHQAALMLLAADYTGGIALATLFQMVPIIGFHEMETDYGAYMWGAKAAIRWFAPSCDDLVCRAEVGETDWERIADRFFKGRRVIETLVVKMYNADRLVAEADFTYWVQDSYSLQKQALDSRRVHILFDHKLKTSAKLIAGLRAMEQEKSPKDRLFDDPYAFLAARNHGVTLAKRFCEYMPQVQPMVAARTRNLDELLGKIDEPVNIVNIGCGLDARPWRLHLGDATYFELDLPLMLDMREEVLPDRGTANGTVVRLAIDLLEQDIDELVSARPEFDPKRPVVVVWEGGSMYFNEEVTSRVVAAVARLMKHPASRFWFDYVTGPVARNTTGMREVELFVKGMRRMGEPFISGYDDVEGLLDGFGLRVEQLVCSDEYLSAPDPMFQHYHFCCAQPG